MNMEDLNRDKHVVTEMPVDQLVIDLPVDEKVVQDKMVSMQQHGLLEPISVWLHDFRIINGFHRTVAAQRLGWPTISCVIYDCPEAMFWDARIDAAKPHATVSEDRMLQWAVECWKSTDWGAALVGETDPNAIALNMAETIWNHGLDRRTFGKMTPQQRAVADWFTEKANRWGMPSVRIIERLMMHAGIDPDRYSVHGRKAHLDDASDKYGLSFQERRRLDQVVPHAEIGNRKRDVQPDCLDAFIAGGAKEDFRAFEQRFREEQRQKAAEQEAHPSEEDVRLAAQREAEAHLGRVVYSFTSYTDSLDDLVHRHADDFQAMPDGYDLFVGLVIWTMRKMHKLWPDRTPQASEVENARLYQRLADETLKRIQAENRLAGKEESIAEIRRRLPDVMAWSESQL